MYIYNNYVYVAIKASQNVPLKNIENPNQNLFFVSFEASKQTYGIND